MSENKVQAEMEASPVVDFFASFFGQCWKEPSTEDDFKFEVMDKKQKSREKSREKKEKKNAKKEKRDKGDKVEKEDKKAKDEAATTSGVAASSNVTEDAALPPKQPTTSKYLIDNSILQNKKAPGISFRNSKCESDKVTCGPGSAKWGDIVEGTEEGDGWLKVGNVYLPMKYQGVPVVTPASGGNPAIPAPASPSKATDKENSEPRSEAAAAQGLLDPSGTAAPEEEIVIKTAQTDAREGEMQASQKADAEVRAEAELVHQLEATAAWFAQPSVGTWLQVRPKLFVQEKVVLVIESEEKCSFFSCEPEEKCVPSLVQEEPHAAAAVEERCAFIFEPEKQCTRASEARPVDVRHLPSVGTWLLRPTPAVRAALAACPMNIDQSGARDEKAQKEPKEVEAEFAQFTKADKPDHEQECHMQVVMDLLQ